MAKLGVNMVNIKEEIKYLTELIKKYPSIKEFCLIRAKLYTVTLQYDKAIKDYESLTDNYLPLAPITICKKYNLIEEMIRCYEKEIKENKNNYMNYTSRSYFYKDIGEKAKAINDCKTALKLCPKNKLVIENIKKLIKELNKMK